jgi:hypothetical protein
VPFKFNLHRCKEARAAEISARRAEEAAALAAAEGERLEAARWGCTSSRIQLA